MGRTGCGASPWRLEAARLRRRGATARDGQLPFGLQPGSPHLVHERPGPSLQPPSQARIAYQVFGLPSAGCHACGRVGSGACAAVAAGARSAGRTLAGRLALAGLRQTRTGSQRQKRAGPAMAAAAAASSDQDERSLIRSEFEELQRQYKHMEAMKKVRKPLPVAAGAQPTRSGRSRTSRSLLGAALANRLAPWLP